MLVASLLEPSLTRSRQPSRSHDLRWLLIPGLTTSLSRGSALRSAAPRAANLPPWLWVTDSPLHPVDRAAPASTRGARVAGPVWRGWPGKSCTSVAPISWEHPREHLISASTETSEATEKEERAAAGKATTKEEWQGEWTVVAPRFSAAQHEAADGSGGAPESTSGALRIQSPGPVSRWLPQGTPPGAVSC